MNQIATKALTFLKCFETIYFEEFCDLILEEKDQQKEIFLQFLTKLPFIKFNFDPIKECLILVIKNSSILLNHTLLTSKNQFEIFKILSASNFKGIFQLNLSGFKNAFHHICKMEQEGLMYRFEVYIKSTKSWQKTNWILLDKYAKKLSNFLLLMQESNFLTRNSLKFQKYLRRQNLFLQHYGSKFEEGVFKGFNENGVKFKFIVKEFLFLKIWLEFKKRNIVSIPYQDFCSIIKVQIFLNNINFIVFHARSNND
eukprot:TRINITY_DN5131_c0_g3_i1.p2 TRINITY_DN5131_c0_g3~~TRINITY_DN5131_c0_g3_i1.p2  ORF type:complete len:255 (-),score=20.27 TRINITY_DN5131_c0_g3_i1:976-1740(-)